MLHYGVKSQVEELSEGSRGTQEKSSYHNN